MTESTRHRPAAGLAAVLASLDERLENEVEVLDAFLLALSRNQLPAEAWEKLASAAQRDDRITELAFAFEGLAGDRKIRTLHAGVVAEFMFQSSVFFGDVMGDDVGAVSYLDRAMAALPTHAGSIARFEQYLTEKGEFSKLGEFFFDLAQHRSRAEQPSLLRKAAEAFERAGASERVADALQLLLRLDPKDDDARAKLENALLGANRPRDVARMLEGMLAADPPPPDDTAFEHRTKLLALYDETKEVERSLPHVEWLLARAPGHEGARSLGLRLLELKPTAQRAASALAAASEKEGNFEEAIRFYTLELEHARGPRRFAALRALAALKHDRTEDMQGAYEAAEAALLLDPTDTELLERFSALTRALGKHEGAIKTLQRLVSLAKEPSARARLAAEMGELLLATNDVKRARAAFSSALTVPGADDAAVLPAAHALARLYAEDEDWASLGEMLERIVRTETDTVRKQAAAEQLAELAQGPLGDPTRAVAAFRGLLETPSRKRALDALEPLLSSMGDAAGLAEVLRAKAADEPSPERKRALLERAADALTETSGNLEAASAAWREIIDGFGPTRNALARWVPLLELQRDFPTLAKALEALAELDRGKEKVGTLARLGLLRMQWLGDAKGAVDAFRGALSIDAQDAISRESLEQLLQSPDAPVALAAGTVLEPLFRAEGARAGLLRILLARAQNAPEAATRAQALSDAVALAEHLPGEHPRVLSLVRNALTQALADDAPVEPWMFALEKLSPGDQGAATRADVLALVLGDGPVTSEALLAVARALGDAAMATGDRSRALDAYKRALDFSPSSPELMAGVDLLLREQGTPHDRVRLYRAALGRETQPEKRRGLHLAIANLQRKEIADSGGAMETLRAALGEGPDDAMEEALFELYSETGAFADACALLEERLSRTAPGDDERQLRSRLARLASDCGLRDRSLVHAKALVEDAFVTNADLDLVEQVAERTEDNALLAMAAARRVELSDAGEDKIFWLTRLGTLQNERGDLQAATAAWREGAALAEQAGDTKTARKLYERIRRSAPYDRTATERLAALVETSGDWGSLPELYAALVESAGTAEDRQSALLKLAEVLAARAQDLPGAFDAAARAFLEIPGDAATLVKLAEYALAAHQQEAFFKTLNSVLADDAGRDPTLRPRLLAAKAEVLAADAARAGEARSLLRAVLDDPFADADTKERSATRFEELLARCDAETEADAWRWLLGWRASREEGPARAAILRRFARLEEEGLHDAGRALTLWRQAVDADPTDAEAASELARSMIASGDVEGALETLRARLASAEAEAASRLRAEIAGLLAEIPGREGEAMAELKTILGDKPDEGAALRLLVKLLAHPEIGAEASGLLEASLGNADAQGRKRVLVALLTGAGDAPADRRKAWHQGLLDLAESQDEAYGVLLRALAELPGEIEWWDRAEQLARRLDRPQELSDAYHAVLSRPLPTEELTELGQRAVAFHEEWFDDASAIVRILDRLVDIDPGGWAFDRLKLLYDSQERWEELFALYDRVLASDIEQTRRTDLLEDAAQIAKDFAKNADRAIGYLEQLLNFKPKNERLLASLERLYERHGRHRELISLLGAQLGGKSVDEAQALRRRMATLWLDELNDAGSALLVVEEMMSEGDASEGSIELLEKVLVAAPAGEEIKKTLPPTSSPVSERVAAAYESIPPPSRASVPPRASSRPGRASVPPKGGRKRVLVRQRTAALLHERYAAAGREADLARVLEVELEAVKNAKERIRRHAEVAALHEKLGNDAAALEHATSLVMLDPDATSHRERLSRLADKTGRFDRLAEVLAAAADDCEGEELRATLLLDAAAAYAEKLGDSGRAIDLLGRVLGLDVGPASQLLAARRLDDLLATSDRKAERLTVLERLAALEDAEARKSALATAARLAAEIGEIDRCIAAWEARLHDDRSDREALDGLVEVLGTHRRLAPLVDTLVARAKVQKDTGSSRADRVRAATLLSGELDSPDAAIDVWEAIRAESGDAEDVDAALTDLYARRERWDNLADLLDAMAKRQPADAQASTLVRLGDVQRTQLGVPIVAVDSYERALATQPGDAGALAGLAALLQDAEAARPALAALLRDRRQQEAWSQIVALLPDRLRLAANDGDRVEILLETASLFEQRVGDLEAAFHSSREAFVLAGGDERVRAEAYRLAEAAAAAGVAESWRALADAHRAVIEALEGKGEATPALAIRMHLGALLEERLEDPRGALVQYTRVAADEPANQAAALALVRVAGRIARWDAATKVVLDRAEQVGSPDEEVLHAVEDAAAAHAGWDGLTAAFEAALGQRSGLSSESARDLEARLAAWHRDRRADAEAAEAAYARALTHDPNDTKLLSHLAQLQRRHSGRPLIDSLLRLSQATGGDPELLREAAEVAGRVVVDRGLAKNILERLLKLASTRWVGSEEHPPSTVTPGAGSDGDAMAAEDPAPSVGNPLHPSEHVEWSLAELVRVHNEEGNAERIVELLEEAAKLPFPRARVRELLHLAAQTALDRLGDAKTAQSLFEQLFAEEPRDEVAAARLAEVYASMGQKEQMLRLRKAQVAVATDPQLRVTHRLEAALIEREMGHVDEAVAVLRENLADVARHPRTTLVLSETLEGASRWAELAAFAAEQAALAEADHDTLSAVELWSRAAAIAEEKLSDLGVALAHYKRSLALELRAPLLDAVARIHEQREEWEPAAEHLDRLAREFPERRASIIVRLADAFARASRDADAQSRLEVALEEPASPPEVATRLAEIYRRTEQFAPLGELIARQARLATSDEARRTALVEAAEIFLSKCAQADRAVPLLEQAAALAPDDRPLRLRLAEALQEAGKGEEARTLLRDMIDGFAGRRPKERAQVHFHLARLHIRNGERANALAELEAATRIDPANPEILRMVAELARDDGQLDKAERSYRALLAVLRRADDDAPVLRTEVLVELGALAERQGETDRATEILESAFETAAGSEAEAKRLEKALRAKGNTAALLRALEARLERAGENAAARADALAELARTQESLGNLAAALRAQLEALALSPASAPAHEQAAALAARAGNPDAYTETTAELADKAAKGGDVRLATNLSLRAAEALLRAPEGAARAADILRRAEAVAPTQPDVLRALDRVYGALGDEEKQEAVLAKLGAIEAEGTARDPRQGADILFRLAALRAKREETLPDAARSLGTAFDLSRDADRTLAIVQDVLSRFAPPVELLELFGRAAQAAGRTDLAQQALRLRAERPDAAVAVLREAAAAALEAGDADFAERSLRRIVDMPSPPDADVARWALLELAALLERSGQLGAALKLELQGARTSEPEEARRLREGVAARAKQAGLAALELEARREIAEADPGDATARAALLEVLRGGGDSAALLEAVDAFLPAVTDDAERRELRRERASVLAGQPARAEEAITELRALLQDDPYDARAVSILSELLEARGETSELGELLERQLDAAKDRQDAEAVAMVTLRLGALAEAGDAERARELYASGLDWEPKNRKLLLALLRLLEGADPADRADVMEKLLETEQGPDAEKLALELAGLRAEQWDDAGAERALEAGFRAHPASALLREKLIAAYEERGDRSKLAALKENAARGLSGAPAKAELLDAARLYQDLGDAAGSARALEAAYEVDPADPEVLRALVGALAARADEAAAAKLLDLASRARGEAFVAIAATRARVLGALGRHEEAVADAERVYESDPAQGRDVLASALATAAEAAAPEAQRPLRQRAAQLCVEAGRLDEAHSQLEALLGLNDADVETLWAMAGIEEKGSHFDMASDTYRRLVDLEQGEQLVAAALHLAAAAAESNNPGYARDGLEKARSAAPGDARVLDKLAAIYEATGATAQLAELRLAEARATDDPARRFEMLVRAGSTLLEQDAAAAAAALEEARAIKPNDNECIGLLGDAFLALERFDDARDVLQGAVTAAKNRRSRELGQIYLRLGRLERALGNKAGAMQMLGSALDMDGQNGIVASELAYVALEEGNLDVATRALRVITMLRVPAPIPKAVAYERLGEIAMHQGDHKRAVMLLKRAIDEDSTLERARELLAQLGN